MIVQIAPAIPVAKVFSYTVPPGLVRFIKTFQRVTVPFHNRLVTGFVIGIEDSDDKALKEIHGIVDMEPLMDEGLFPLCQWASGYYVAPMGMVLRYVLPTNLQVERHLAVNSLQAHTASMNNLALTRACKTHGRQQVLNAYRDGGIDLHDRFTGLPIGSTMESGLSGNGGQTLFQAGIEARVAYYKEQIGLHLDRGDNVLFLLPDYRTTGKYLFQLLSDLFAGRIHWYGASVKGSTRMETFFRARSEKGLLILGNRSCAFLPVSNLSLIIVERPEEDEYRNEEGFRFNAWVVARKRAELKGVPIIFGSASPPLELVKAVADGEICLLEADKPGVTEYSEIPVEKWGAIVEGLPQALVDTVKNSILEGRVTAIFSPRRYYGAFIECMDCKAPFTCPTCNGNLTFEKSRGKVFCGPCNREVAYEEVCTHCGSNLIRFARFGTEYLEEYFRRTLAPVPVLRVTGESSAREMQALRALTTTSPALIIGTQVLSKVYGLTVDTLILFGWEELLTTGGYRASEKCVHIFVNLLDALQPRCVYLFREGKKKVKPPDFMNPENFYRDELSQRKAAEFPPYMRLFLIETEKKTALAAEKAGDKVMRLIQQKGMEENVTGPLVTGGRMHRWRIILKGDPDLLSGLLGQIYLLPDIRVEADPLYV